MMTTAELIRELTHKHFGGSSDKTKLAVNEHRQGHPEWNWVDAATDLLHWLDEYRRNENNEY